jgi:hypothetical protein
MSANADITIIEKSDGEVTKSYFSDGKTSVYQGDFPVNITDIKNKKIYGFNPMQRTYYVVTFDEMKQMATRMQKQMEAMKSNPQYQQFMGKMNSVKAKVKKIGKASFAGYSCDKYEISLDGAPTKAVVCLSAKLAKKVEKEIGGSSVTDWAKGMDFDGDSDPISKELEKLEENAGYLLYEEIGGMAMGMEKEVRVVESISSEKIPEYKFKIPSGYRKVNMSEMMGGY